MRSKESLKKLNRLEHLLQAKLDSLMYEEGVKFTIFLPVLRPHDLPVDTKSQEYKNKHKTEYLKHLRASFSLEEIVKILKVLNYELKLTLDNKAIRLKKIKLPDEDIKIRYTDFMAICELLGVNIEWLKTSIERQGEITSNT